jgi:hypothetical protein
MNLNSIITRERRKKLKNILIENIDTTLSKLPLSRLSLGILIRSIHICSPLIFFLLLLFSNNKILCNIVIIFIILAIVLFLLFNGCFISSLENRIIGDDFNVIDPFLEIFNIQINFKNRLKMSYLIGVSYFFIILYIFIYRFYV